MPRAFITGVTGKDGQHMAEILQSKGYEIFGMVKGQNNPKGDMLRDEFPYVNIVPGDLADLPSLVKAMEVAQPDEIYNLAAISFVALSWNQAELTANLTGTGVLRMLEAMRMVGGNTDNKMRFYQASSSEMFGKVRQIPQTELDTTTWTFMVKQNSRAGPHVIALAIVHGDVMAKNFGATIRRTRVERCEFGLRNLADFAKHF